MCPLIVAFDMLLLKLAVCFETKFSLNHPKRYVVLMKA
jgi:hypothetical protein